jgi:phosphatidylinositol glycan class C protein
MLLIKDTQMRNFETGDDEACQACGQATPRKGKGAVPENEEKDETRMRLMSDSTPSSSTPPQWKRVLYLKQSFEDSYVDPSFLQLHASAAASQRMPAYWSTCFGTAAVTQRVSAVILLAAVFFELWSGGASPPQLMRSEAAALAVVGVVWLTQGLPGSKVEVVRTVVLLGVALFVCSPLLQTLTLSYSSDTIWALSLVLSVVHVCVHDFHYINSPTPVEFNGSFSLNAGIFASVLLASRLGSALEVYAFVTAAFLTHIGLPLFSSRLRKKSAPMYTMLSVALFLVTTAVLYARTHAVMYIYVASVTFVTFLVPFYLKWIHQYKHEIRGGWDYDAHAELETI